MKLTQERLKELLHYDPETGVFVWLVKKAQRIEIGQRAGNIDKTTGYRRINIDGKLHKASRLAWFYMEGYFSENDVDHRNRIRHDDRWENLRHISQQCNSRNCSISKNNKSGIVGVFWYKPSKKWKVDIMISGKHIFLGYFNSKLNAARARWNAEVDHGFPSCNTTSTAYLYLKDKGGLRGPHNKG